MTSREFREAVGGIGCLLLMTAAVLAVLVPIVVGLWKWAGLW